MTYEFICPHGHVNTRKFSTIGKAIAHFESSLEHDTYDKVYCKECFEDTGEGVLATRNYGNSGTQFYGEGWDRPAPSGKQFTKGTDPHKALSGLGRPTNNSVIGR